MYKYAPHCGSSLSKKARLSHFALILLSPSSSHEVFRYYLLARCGSSSRSNRDAGGTPSLHQHQRVGEWSMSTPYLDLRSRVHTARQHREFHLTSHTIPSMLTGSRATTLVQRPVISSSRHMAAQESLARESEALTPPVCSETSSLRAHPWLPSTRESVCLTLLAPNAPTARSSEVATGKMTLIKSENDVLNTNVP
jgi:hypothetical protein